MATPYLPPGWTQERFDQGSGADFFSLPEEELDRVLEYQNARYGTQSDPERTTEFKSRLRQRQNAAREQQGRPPRLETPPRPSQLVQVVETNGHQAEWGFVLFRLHYDDDNLWERFQEAFTNLIEKSVEEDGGITRIEQGLMVNMVVDQQMKEARMEDIPGFFHAVEEAGEVPSGLSWSMCLVVDKASMMSVANGDALPFVVAVDVHNDPAEEIEEGCDEGYEGHFKAAISSLLPELYPALASNGWGPEDLWRHADPIFKDVWGS